MKINLALSIFLFFFSIIYSTAQEIFVPYRVGDKFGFSNEKGKLLFDAEYDRIEFIGDGYYTYTKITIDSTRMYGGKPEEKKLKGVIFKGKKIVVDQEYTDYFVDHKKQFIIGSYNPYRPENCMLYNFSGESLFRNEAKSMEIIKNIFFTKMNPNLVILNLYKRRIKRGGLPSTLLVYDIKKQIISDTILVDALDLEFGKTLKNENMIAINYSSSMAKFIKYNSVKKKFEIVTDYKNANSNRNKNRNEYREEDTYIPLGDSGYMDEEVEEAYDDEYKNLPFPKKIYFTILRKDSTFSYDGKPVPKIPNATYIFEKYNQQQSPIIYKVGKKHGIISSNEVKTPPVFDSLFYIRQSKNLKDKTQFPYLAGQRNPESNKWEFGVVDQFGKEIIPIIYDTLLSYIPQLRYEEVRGETILQLRDPDWKSYYSKNRPKPKNLTLKNGRLLGVKNGKHGVLTINNDIIVPFEYDGIYTNDVLYLTPIDRKLKFYIFKKDGKYGFNYKLKDDPKKINNRIVFPFYPTTILPNFYGHKGFNLVCLTQRSGVFCFASEEGEIYYKEKLSKK